jgi:D-3-phosphoglycerate dehydrogenase
VIGEMGSVLGRRDINIARMTVGRKPGSRRAVMILEVDSEVPAEALPELTKVSGVREVRAIALD